MKPEHLHEMCLIGDILISYMPPPDNWPIGWCLNKLHLMTVIFLWMYPQIYIALVLYWIPFWIYCVSWTELHEVSVSSWRWLSFTEPQSPKDLTRWVWRDSLSFFPRVKRYRKLASTIMKKWKNGSHFVENCSTAKIQITFLSGDGNWKWVSTIMKRWKNGSHFMENHGTIKFKITDPPKVWVSTPILQ